MSGTDARRNGIGDGFGILVAERKIDCGCIFEELGWGRLHGLSDGFGNDF